MPRRSAKVTQAEIVRALRAAKEAGAGDVFVTNDGDIRIAREPSPPAEITEQKVVETADGWELSEPPRRVLKTESTD